MNKYNGIDIAKSLSIIGIVLMHVLANSQYQLNGFVFEQLIPSFTDLVFLFMMISAFGMCCGYYERIQKNEISIEKFYSRRYSKLWPFFAVLCLLDLVLSPSLDSLYEVFANLTMLQGLLPNPNIEVIGVSWTLAVIFVFYLLFPFFVFLLSDKKRAWFAFLISILMNIVCQVYFFNSEHVLSNLNYRENILYSGMFFMSGGLIYLYRDQIQRLFQRYKSTFIGATFLYLIFYYWISRNVFSNLILFSLLLILTISYCGKSYRVFEFFSEISFEVYLSHMVIFRILEKIHLTNISIVSDVLSYFVVSLFTIFGAIIFSKVLSAGIEIIKNRVKEKLIWQKRN